MTFRKTSGGRKGPKAAECRQGAPYWRQPMWRAAARKLVEELGVPEAPIDLQMSNKTKIWHNTERLHDGLTILVDDRHRGPKAE